MPFPLLILSLLPALPQASPYLITQVQGPAHAEYLIVAADTLAEGCDPLLTYRKAQGRSVGLVRFGDVCQAYGSGRPDPEALIAFLKHAYTDWQTRYVLLVGRARDPAGPFIPMRLEQSGYYSTQVLSTQTLTTDYAYATLGGEDIKLHVGRFPVGTPEELAALINKTIGYETRSAPGPWQRKLTLVTGKLGVSPMVDAMVETVFTKLMQESLPPAYGVEVACAQPQSIYCPYPPDFNREAVRLLNDGALAYVYVGHANEHSLQDLPWQGRSYPILSERDLPRVNVTNGLPLVVALACSTGNIAAVPTIGEKMIALPTGPVAFLGASTICQPYGSALLGRALITTLFAPKRGTVGEADRTIGAALDEAKRRCVAPDDSPFRKQVDTFAAMVQGMPSLPGMRHDVVRHYSLLGDPALVLRLPSELPLTVERSPDGKLRVTGRAPFADGAVEVTLESALGKSARPLKVLPPDDSPDIAAAMSERWHTANDRVFTRVTVPVQGGSFRAELAAPADLPPASYVVRAFAWSPTAAAAGAQIIPVPAKP